jgi:hypothetical protein
MTKLQVREKYIKTTKIQTCLLQFPKGSKQINIKSIKGQMLTGVITGTL